MAAFRDPTLGVAISTAVGGLTRAIEDVLETATRFKPVLNHLNDTISWITPRIREISRSEDFEDEIQRLLDLLNEAKRNVDKCSRISSWNYYKKYKMAKKLIELDNSIRTTVQLFFPVMILGDTRQILDSVDELKLLFLVFFFFMLDDFNSSAKNTGGVVSDMIRSNSKASIEKIIKSQPAELVSDIALWKKKELSGSLLASSTVTWLLQQVYEYNFLTIASWVIIFIVTLLFVWRNVNRFQNREEAMKSRLEEIREKMVTEIANACWELSDQIIRWILNVTDVEKEWFVFPQTIVFLLIFSYMGNFFDLPTLCKGVMMGTTLPVMCAKHKDKVQILSSLVMDHSGKAIEMVGEILADTVNKSFAVDERNKKKSKKQN
ncbi:Reticulon [Corchorus olitorius]|uniref:Reticulon-like protein n=1 Tax=Corchorus olitorius TaxID=93759 RepID=A0A1R3K4S5_9ROSI|nr:Reticulon [Corchorus olitorius]